MSTKSAIICAADNAHISRAELTDQARAHWDAIARQLMSYPGAVRRTLDTYQLPTPQQAQDLHARLHQLRCLLQDFEADLNLLAVGTTEAQA
ncbi:hypothetical protein [Rothia sp. 11273D007AR]